MFNFPGLALGIVLGIGSTLLFFQFVLGTDLVSFFSAEWVSALAAVFSVLVGIIAAALLFTTWLEVRDSVRVAREMVEESAEAASVQAELAEKSIQESRKQSQALMELEKQRVRPHLNLFVDISEFSHQRIDNYGETDPTFDFSFRIVMENFGATPAYLKSAALQLKFSNKGRFPVENFRRLDDGLLGRITVESAVGTILHPKAGAVGFSTIGLVGQRFSSIEEYNDFVFRDNRLHVFGEVGYRDLLGEEFIYRFCYSVENLRHLVEADGGDLNYNRPMKLISN